MVEAVTQYKTFDGKIFHDEYTAIEWECDVNMANAILSMFPNNSHLQSGDFYRLSMQLVRDGRQKLANVIRKSIGEQNEKQLQNFVDGAGSGIIGRIMCDSQSPYNRVLTMFDSIDDHGRMFNQPYYANNPKDIGTEVGY